MDFSVSGQRNRENGSALSIAPEADKMGQFLGPETDVMSQFLQPETDIMCERFYMLTWLLLKVEEIRVQFSLLLPQP